MKIKADYKTIPFFLVDSFTEQAFHGNPAGVFFDPDGLLTDDEYKRLCAEVSLESAFVLPPTQAGADVRLRYFTSASEVPLCGHATVAAFAAQVQRGDQTLPTNLNVQTNVGLLRVELAQSAESTFLCTIHQNPAIFGPVFSTGEVNAVADALGINAKHIHDSGLPVQVASTGTPEIYVPVASREAVNHNAALQNQAAIIELSKQYAAFGIYLFTVERDNDTVSTWSRCFDPIADLPEDPVTGSASGALGGYLVENGVVSLADGESQTIQNRQGYAGKRGGDVLITVRRNGATVYPSITGTATVVASGTFAVSN